MASVGWTCATCTVINENPIALQCEVCTALRSATASSPAAVQAQAAEKRRIQGLQGGVQVAVPQHTVPTGAHTNVPTPAPRPVPAPRKPRQSTGVAAGVTSGGDVPPPPYSAVVHTTPPIDTRQRHIPPGPPHPMQIPSLPKPRVTPPPGPVPEATDPVAMAVQQLPPDMATWSPEQVRSSTTGSKVSCCWPSTSRCCERAGALTRC